MAVWCQTSWKVTLVAVIESVKVTRPYDSNKTGYTTTYISSGCLRADVVYTCITSVSSRINPH
jgi:hypothetical protein